MKSKIKMLFQFDDKYSISTFFIQKNYFDNPTIFILRINYLFSSFRNDETNRGGWIIENRSTIDL